MYINKISITNRPDYLNRIIGARLSLSKKVGNDKVTVYTYSFQCGKDKYDIVLNTISTTTTTTSNTISTTTTTTNSKNYGQYIKIKNSQDRFVVDKFVNLTDIKIYDSQDQLIS